MSKKIIVLTNNPQSVNIGEIQSVVAPYRIGVDVCNNTKNFIKLYDVNKLVVYKNDNDMLLPQGSNMFFSSVKNNICKLDELQKILPLYISKQETKILPSRSVSSFCDFIKIPPICSTNILIKYCLLFASKFNIKKINFSTLHFACNYLSLDWKIEVALLRSHLRNWIKNNYNFIKRHYPFIDLKSDKVLFLINDMYTMLKSEEHKGYSETNLTSLDLIGRFNVLLNKDKRIAMKIKTSQYVNLTDYSAKSSKDCPLL